MTEQQTPPQYWADRRLARGVGIASFHHSDKKKSTKYGVTEEAHHEIRVTDKMDGTTMLLKIFVDGRLAISMNGPFNLTATELALIAEAADKCREGCTEIY